MYRYISHTLMASEHLHVHTVYNRTGIHHSQALPPLPRNDTSAMLTYTLHSILHLLVERGLHLQRVVCGGALKAAEDALLTI